MGSEIDQPLAVSSLHAWEAWLAEHHATAREIWVKLAKKGSGIESINHAEAVEVALCYGWIDGKATRLDDLFWLQRFTPRTPRSKWSKLNRIKAEELIASGRMKPAGIREVCRAKQDGRWDAGYP